MAIRLQRWKAVTRVSGGSEIRRNLPPLSRETKGLVVNSPFLSSVECPSRMGSGDKVWDSWENKTFQFKILRTMLGCKRINTLGKYSENRHILIITLHCDTDLPWLHICHICSVPHNQLFDLLWLPEKLQVPWIIWYRAYQNCARQTVTNWFYQMLKECDSHRLCNTDYRKSK